jgi:hypothetical protein
MATTKEIPIVRSEVKEIRLFDIEIVELLSDLIDVDIMSLKFQKIVKSLLNNQNISDYETFSTFDLVKVNTKFNLNHYLVEDQFSIHTTTCYTSPKLFTRNRETGFYNLNRSDFKRGPSLIQLYELILPYYEMANIFQNFIGYQFRISARPCSSTSIVIHTDTYFCKNNILLNPIPPKYKGNRLMGSSYESSLPAPISPPRLPVLQSGLNTVNLNFSAEIFKIMVSECLLLTQKDISVFNLFKSGNLVGFSNLLYLYRDLENLLNYFSLPRVQMGLFDVGVDVTKIISPDTEDTIRNSISSVANSFKSISHDFSASTTTIISQLLDLRKNVSSEDFKKFTTEHFDSFKGNFAPINIMEGMCKNISVISLIAAGGYALIARTEESYYVFGACVVACAWFNKDSIMDFLLLWFKHREPISEFGFVGDDFFTGALVLLGGMTFSNTVLTKLPKEILTQLGSFSRVKSTLKDIFDFVVRLVDMLLKSLGARVNVPSWVKFLNVQDELVKKFFQETDEIYEKIRLKNFPICADNYLIVLDLQRKGREVTLQLKNAPPALVQLVQSQNMWLTKLRQTFTDANFSCDGLRPLPVCILLSGTPGTGKSQSMEWFARAICARVLEGEKLETYRKDPSKSIYARNFETVYWDSYDNDKLVCLFDDFSQAKDIAGSPDNEQMNLIRCIDEIPYCLHMAALGDKGNTYFTSKFVICTTNMVELKAESIYSIDALKRRLHISLECFPKAEYAMKVNGIDVLDPSKLPIGVDGETEILPEEMLMYRERDNYTKTYTGKVFTFSQAVDEFVRQYHQNRKRFDQKVRSLSQYVDRVILTRKSESSTSLSTQLSWDSDTDVDHKGEILSYHFDPKKGMNVPDLLDMVDMEELSTASPSSDDLVYDIRDLVVAQGNFDSKELAHDFFSTDYFDDIDLANLDEFFHDFTEEKVENLQFQLKELLRLAPKFDLRFVNIEPGMLTKALYKKFSVAVFNTLTIPGMIEAGNPYARYLIDSIELIPMTPIVKEPEGYKSWNSVFTENVKLASSLLYTTFGCTMRFALSWIIEHKTYIFVAIGLIGGLTKVFSRKKESDIPLIGDYQSLEQKESKHKVQRKYISKMRTGVAQMSHGRDKNGSQLVDKFVRLNCYEILLHTNEGVRPIGFLTFIVNRLAIMQEHFLDGIDSLMEKGKLFEDSQVQIRLNKYGGEKAVSYFFKLDEFVQFVNFTERSNEKDFVLLDFPRRVHMHKDLRHLIPSAKDLAKLREYPIRLIVPKNENRQDGVAIAKPLNNMMFRKTNDPSSDLMHIRTGYEYHLGTEYGDCGGWVTLQVPECNFKLIGLHVAGDNGAKGFASALCSEDIEDLLTSVENEKSASVIIEEDLQAQPAVVAQGQFLELYTVDKVPFNVNKTAIIKSKLHNKWMPALTMPSCLRPKKVNGEMVYPMEKALQKYCLPNLYIDKRSIEEAADMYFDTLASGTVYVDKRLYTYEEAIMGLLDDPDFGSLTRSTSPGYPYNVEGHKKKFTLFGSDDIYDLTTKQSKELKELCEDIILNASKGIRMNHIFYDNLKDERRPKAKVEEASTRMFSGSPVHLTVVFRMMFGAFILFYHKNRINNGSAIGVNPYSCEWHDITLNLLQKGHPDDRCVGAGDFSRYDGSQKGDIHWLILDIINQWYGDSEENQRIRQILWIEVTNSVHLNGENVVMWPNSLPSGHAMTAIVNTMYNNIAFRYCWLKAVEGTRLSASHFREYVYLIALGDDNIFSVHPLVRSIYNEITIGRFMKQLGLTYTNESKTESIELLRKIDSVEFLKRGFRKCKELNRYVAPLRLDVVLEMPMWTKVKDADTITLDNVNCSLRELSLHGREVFQNYGPKIAQALKEEYNEWPSTTSYISNLSAISTEDCPW